MIDSFTTFYAAAPPVVVALAAFIALSLIVYALSGGADYGGGVWDLLASGPRAKAQRRAIEAAIGPIWEANHVWLIVVVVLLFSCFPRAFSVIGIALHIPLTLMAIGIVLRGAAFVFRSYDAPGSASRRLWGRVFAIFSTVTPVMIGVCAGAVASGAIGVEDGGAKLTVGFIESWWAPFPLAIGGLTVSLFAFLAATYLAQETRGDGALAEDFRRRGLGAALAVALFAGLAFWLSTSQAPHIRQGLGSGLSSMVFQGLTGAVSVGAIAALWQRSYGAAAWAARAQVALILMGWFGAQLPYVVPPHLTFVGTAAPPEVLEIVLTTLVVGSALIVPSFAFLMKVFKGQEGG